MMEEVRMWRTTHPPSPSFPNLGKKGRLALLIILFTSSKNESFPRRTPQTIRQEFSSPLCEIKKKNKAMSLYFFLDFGERGWG